MAKGGIMAKMINLSVVENPEKRLTLQRRAADGYSESTGERETTSYTGPWAAVLEFAAVQVAGAADAWQVVAEVERQEGMIGTLTVTRERFSVAAGGDDEGEDDGDEGEAGEAPLGSEENPVYTSSSTLVANCILLHPKFSELKERELRALKAMIDGQDENSLLSEDEVSATGGRRIKDMITSEAGRKAMEYIRKGVTQWPEVQTQVTARWRGRTNRYTMRQIVASAPGSISTPDGCNWRVDGVGTEDQGSTVWQTVTLTLSGPGGWDEWLYKSGS